jgi:asparagine synthetase B (glutamine-hydrolysing)
MSGIFGFFRNTSQTKIDSMLGLLNQYPNNRVLHHFCDNNVCIANIGLLHHKDCKYSDKDIELSIAGTCYNLCDFSADSFADLIVSSYRDGNLTDTLAQVDGCFHFCLYDKKNQKIIIACDRFGLYPLFIYSQDGNFAFGAESKSLLKLDFVDTTIDPDSFSVFEKIGYLLGSSTWFKYIKRIKPATIMTFDMQTHELISCYYWTFANIKKSDVSFYDAVEIAHRLFSDSVRRQVNPLIKSVIPISAGYDSRLILAAAKELYPNYNPYTTTFGVKNCLDIITAHKVCKVAGIKKNHENLFENIDWLGARENMVYDCDCTFSLQHMHGLEFIDTFGDARCLINGYLGDTIFGGSYLPTDTSLYNHVIDESVAKYYFGDYYRFCDFDDEYFQINNPIVLMWFNRGNNFINEAQRLCYNTFDIAHPFFDNKIIEFIASLPNEYLQYDRLYNALVLKHYPKYFKFIGRNGNRPAYLKKGLAYRYNKMKFALDKLLRTIRIKPRIVMAYANYTKWVQEHPNKERLMQLLNRDTSFYSKYTDTDYCDLLCHVNSSNISQILSVASVEIYFSQLKKQKIEIEKEMQNQQEQQ